MQAIEPVVDAVQLGFDLVKAAIDLVEAPVDIRSEVVQPIVGPALSHRLHDRSLKVAGPRPARGDAWLKHQELSERITAAFDGARGEPGARPSATSTTSGFVIGAIEETLCLEIATGRAAAAERLLSDLTHLAFLQLFGEDDSAESAAEDRS